MKNGSIARSLAWASCIALAGCAAGNDVGTDDSLDTAQQRLARDRADVADGLVDRIELGPNHTLSFFVLPDGTTLVGERASVGTPSTLAKEAGASGTGASETIDALYAHLAPGRAVPQALRNVTLSASADPAAPTPGLQDGGERWVAPPAPAGRTSGDTTVTRSALTDSAADDAFFRNNFCPTGGVFAFCVVDWTGGRFAQATSDHSIANTAFTWGTGSIQLRFSGSNGLVSEKTILPGEVQTWIGIGPTISVKNAGCGCCSACQTHYEAKSVFQKWEVTGATGKTFDFGGRFYSAPTHWNTF